MQMDEMPLMIFIGLALCSQSFVVIMNADQFMDWLRVSFDFDLWDYSEWTRDNALDDPEAGEDDDLLTDGHAKKGFGFLHFIRRPVENRLKKTILTKAQGMVASSSKSMATRLSSARSINICVKVCIFLSWLHVTFALTFNLSFRTVFFRCQEDGQDLLDSNKYTFKPHMMYTVFISQSAIWVLLVIAAVCVNWCRWACHLTVKPVDCKSVKAAQRLREHFKKDGETPEGLPRYVPKLAGGYPEDDLLPLSIMEGQYLAGVRYKGVLYGQEDLRWLIDEEVALEGEGVPNKAGEEVTLLFKKGKPGLMSYFMNFAKVAKNPDRGISIALHFVAGVFMIIAALSCWTCVAGINVKADAGLTASAVDKQLLLLGACGRLGGIGNATFLAGMALLSSMGQQLMVMFLVDEKGLDMEENPNPQLSATLIDFRRNAGLDIEQFEEAEAEAKSAAEAEREAKGPSAASQEQESISTMCYVWVDRKSKVVDAAVRCPRLDERALHERAGWTRSREPRRVRLLRKSSARRQQMIKGLPKDYGAPTICIEVLDSMGQKRSPMGTDLEATVPKGRGSESAKGKGPKPTRVQHDPSEIGSQQIVPAKFIAGLCHADVNLGPRLAWEAMSQTLSLGGMMLAGMDIVFYSIGAQSGTLRSCRDVKNSATCFTIREEVHHGDYEHFDLLDWHHFGWRPRQGQPVDFRPSTGPFLSTAAIAVALVGLLALRVAANNRMAEQPRPFSVGEKVRQYCRELCTGVLLPPVVVRWACGSLYAGFRNIPFCRRRQFSCQVSSDPFLRESSRYTRLHSS